MLLSTRGIVFRTIRYGETSIIADIFTEAHGLHTFIGGGVRTAKSKMPFGLFQPMMVVDLVSYFRPDEGALNRLKEVKASVVYRQIPFDLKRGTIAMFMAEICQKTIRESEENGPLFDFLLDTLLYLDTTTHPVANVHLHFLLQLSAFLGFQPEVPDNANHEPLFFDQKEGVFSPEKRLHSAEALESALLIQLLQIPLDICHELPLNRAERKNLLQQLLLFYGLHVPGLTTINAVEVLETVWS
jgi:DNA repair protein RecO (recombination protein O)